MDERGRKISPDADRAIVSKTRAERTLKDEQNQMKGEATRFENSQDIDFSKTMSPNDGTSKEQNTMHGSFLFEDNSEYFSKLGEEGRSNLVSLRATELNLEDIEEIRKMFNVFDQDSNGVITANELRTIMSSLGQSTTEAEVMDMVNFIDSDGNGLIEFPEFLTMVNGTVPKSLRQKQLERLFKVFDIDNSDEITAGNLRRMFHIFGQTFDDKSIATMLREADVDGDGKVTIDDFIKMMNT